MPIYIAIIGFIVSFFTGGAAGSVITLTVTGRRDKRQRRSSFLGFLKQWLSDIENATMSTWGLGVGTASEQAYRAKIAPFQFEVERVRDVFTDAERFNALTSRLGSLKAEDWQKKQPRDVILETIDELIRFAA